MNNMDLIKGIGIGMIAGGTLGMAMTSNKRKVKKTKKHAMKAMGDVADSVVDMLGF